MVVNHLRSLNGIEDAVDGVRVRAKRKAQGESVAQLLVDLQTMHPDVPVISVGDYNAFEVNDGFVDVLGIIRGDQAPPEQVAEWSALGLDTNLVSAAPTGDYSYSFDGNAQTLDHVLLTAAASAALSGFGHAHVDADFPELLRSDPARPERSRITIRQSRDSHLRSTRSRRCLRWPRTSRRRRPPSMAQP